MEIYAPTAELKEFSNGIHDKINPFIGPVVSSVSLIIQQLHFGFHSWRNFIINFPLPGTINMSAWRPFD